MRIPSTKDPVGVVKQAKLGIVGGGWLTGGELADDGTLVARGDSYGAFVWDAALDTNRTLLTAPNFDRDSPPVVNDGAGTYEIVVAPSWSAVMYAAYGGLVFKTVDKGVKWTRTSFAQVVTPGANGNYRLCGRKMAVDPVDPDHCWATWGGRSPGVRVTTDGGKRWTTIAPSVLPLPSTAGSNNPGAGYAVAFDRSVATAGGRSPGIVVMVQGVGVHRSTDGGASFALLHGGPVEFATLKIAANGVIFVTGDGGGTGNVNGGITGETGPWRYAAGAWTRPTGGSAMHSICIKPSDPNKVFGFSMGGTMSASTDGGRTFVTVGNGTRDATGDAPWLGWINEYMSNGDTAFDPTADRIWFFQGVGIWHLDNPPTKAGTAFTWRSRTRGIDQMCMQRIKMVPGKKRVFAVVQDRVLMRWNTDDPYSPMRTLPIDKGAGVENGTGFDYAGDDHDFLVATWYGTAPRPRFSRDLGVTWNACRSPVDNDHNLGCIAVSTKLNWVYALGYGTNAMYRTKDGGQTWAKCVIGGGAAIGYNMNGATIKRTDVVADKEVPGTFYWINWGNEQASGDAYAGIWKSTDGGDTWLHAYPHSPSGSERTNWDAYNCQLACVPGKAGHLFYTGGDVSHYPGNNLFTRSTDGGMTWTEVAGFRTVFCFGFGKAVDGGAYPAIYASGFYHGKGGYAYGLYRSLDNAMSWTRLLDGLPLAQIDGIVWCMDGDMDIFGRVYLGFPGSGGAVLD